MNKRKILFVINQLFKGGAETALLNLLGTLSPQKYDIDLLIFDQIDLPDTISLIPELPEWIHVVNVAQKEGLLAFFKKAVFNLHRRLTHTQAFRQSAIRYARAHEYDVAISFGEWFSSALVANEVRASRKYVWIHADIDKASFLHPDILRYHQQFDGFIFVSEHSKQAALEQYPVLNQRAFVVHNLVDRESILHKSTATVNVDIPDDGRPLLLTVANVRAEKNHVRQVRVMKKLKERGIRFRWVNIGSLANLEQTALLTKAIQQAGLQEEFLLLGAMDNPYPVIRRADAVCVLSDHESWSMVITEAKTLGVPVVATRTSGALAQIDPGETGVLCDFSDEDIGEKIEQFLTDRVLSGYIRENLNRFSSSEETLRQLEPLLLNEEKKVLYVFDDINYVSGARNAALKQIECLSERAEVTLFSAEPCGDQTICKRYRTVDLADNAAFRCLSVPIRQVWSDENIGKKIKLLRAAYAVMARLRLDYLLYEWLLNRELSCFMENFDTICVVSEASKLRSTVSKVQHPCKVQWIHTDYVAWREQSSWTRAITKRDPIIYKNFDHIVCLSKRLKDKFSALYPQLAEKTVVIPNFVDHERITKLSEARLTVEVDNNTFNLITVGRMEWEKRHDRLLEIAAELKRQGTDFHWYFVGDGKLLENTKALCRNMGLEKEITFTGAMENPYPLMKQCDLFVLLSDYEGTPVTIDEAKVLGLPILANDVGGISDMLADGAYGTVVSKKQPIGDIIENLAGTQKHRQTIFQQEACAEYNQNIMCGLKNIERITLL